MNSGEYAVAILYGTNHALRAERVLREAGIGCKLIPVPRHISSDCGVCVRVARCDGDRVLSLLAEARVQVEGIHEI